jgi:hypothetical protein
VIQERRCHRCRQPVLEGDTDSNRAAVPYRMDRDPLDCWGELDAVHSGRLTWTLHSTGHVYARSARIIAARPAGSRLRQSVHADHVCAAKGET